MSYMRLALAAVLFAGYAAAQITPDAGPAPRPSDIQNPGTDGLVLPMSNRPRIMLCGYWPPTNEMLRPWSPNKVQNPKGWTGSNWEKRGYDVYAFFPEFPTGTFPWGKGDFEVDYQDTSADWARLTKLIKPQIIMTFSRGFSGVNWEIELNARNWNSWVSDRRPPNTPTPSPPDSSVPGNTYRRSTLPANDIVAALNKAGVQINPRLDTYGTGGTYLSEFMSYHGIWYQGANRNPASANWCLAAGHVHVGTSTPVALGTRAVEVQLRTLIAHANRIVRGDCQANHGFGGLGTGYLTVCGKPLATGGSADLTLTGAPPSVPAILMLAATGQRASVLDRLFLSGGVFAGAAAADQLRGADRIARDPRWGVDRSASTRSSSTRTIARRRACRGRTSFSCDSCAEPLDAACP